MQRGMVHRNALLPQNKRIEFRVGANFGDIIASPLKARISTAMA
jgi:class 3 adenylate cyclase